MTEGSGFQGGSWTRRRFLAAGAGLVLVGCGRTARPVVLYPDPILRTPALPFEGEGLETLVRDLVTTAARHGARGLAAPQIGVGRRVLVANLNTQIVTMVNPVVVSEGGNYRSWEGCLSLPDLERREIPRRERIRLAYRDPDGTSRVRLARGQAAAVLQHELDHLDGRLIVDYG